MPSTVKTSNYYQTATIGGHDTVPSESKTIRATDQTSGYKEIRTVPSAPEYPSSNVASKPSESFRDVKALLNDKMYEAGAPVAVPLRSRSCSHRRVSFMYLFV
ncbi:hypothetical protein FLONG3_1285, partial [Fusarium longipes]